jgi:hypothetical protein
MSAEDTAATATKVAPDDATAPAENGTTAAAATNGDATNTDSKKGGNNKRNNNRKDYNKDDDKPEVPIEELFDLTKPIPRVSEIYL